MALAVLSGILFWLMMSFLASILLNCVDATFLCYAMDKDCQAVTKAEIHDAFNGLMLVLAYERLPSDSSNAAWRGG